MAVVKALHPPVVSGVGGQAPQAPGPTFSGGSGWSCAGGMEMPLSEGERQELSRSLES
jgi:hypothetical protein